MAKEKENIQKETSHYLVPFETAASELKAWFDFKKVSDDRRAKLGSFTLVLIESLMTGTISIHAETKVITHKLKFPVGVYNELTYKPRITVSDAQTYLQMANQKDNTDVVLAYGAALSGVSPVVLKQLDTEDYMVLEKLAFFFMD